MDIHLHWFTSAALAITEILTARYLLSTNRLPVFRRYLIVTAVRVLLPYFRIGDSPLIDGAILLLRAAVVAELFLEIGWRIRGQEKTGMLLSVGCFQIVACVALFDFPVQPDAWHPGFILVRQIAHVELFIAVLTAVLWVWYHNARRTRFSLMHGILLAVYLLDYCVAGFWIATRPAGRCSALAAFDIATMLLLWLWTAAARACDDPPIETDVSQAIARAGRVSPP